MPVIWYILLGLLGGFWICQGLWLIVSAIWDLLRLALFGFPGDNYRDDQDDDWTYIDRSGR